MVAMTKRLSFMQVFFEPDKQKSVTKSSDTFGFFLRRPPQAKLIFGAVNESWARDQSALADLE